MRETITTPLGSEQVAHPRATSILVTGILGITIIPFLGPVAWALGRSALREIDAEPTRYSNRSIVQAGMILGIISTLILIVGLALIVTIIIWVTTGDGIKSYDHEEAIAFIASMR